MTALARTTRLVPVHPRPGRRGALSAVLVAAFVTSLVALDTSRGVVHTGGLRALGELVGSIIRPDLSPDYLLTVVQAAVLTLAYAVTGMTVALLVGVPGALLASGVLVRRRVLRVPIVAASRGVLGVLRAIHELIWALLFVQAFGLSPVAGVLAIGLPYGATVARVLAERLADVPEEPLAALRTAGASPWQVLAYGRMPMVAADAVGYVFYRFECAVRAAAVLSFVGLGGIGYLVEIALADLRFTRVWTALFALIGLVVALDMLSARLRRRLMG